jgi:hypothetical protein
MTCDRCDKTAVHSDGISRLCGRCFNGVFRRATSAVVERHREDCAGVCADA